MLASLLSIFLLTGATAPTDVNLLGRPAKAWASSELAAKDPGRYAVKNAFDGDRQTAWVEGVPGVGEGQSLFLEFPQPTALAGFMLLPGYARNTATLLQNSAPAEIELYADGARVLGARIHWVMELPDDAERCVLTKDSLNLSPRMVVFSRTLTAKKLELRIVSAVKGTKFEDTGIAEWWPIFDGVPAAMGADSYQDAEAALASLRPGNAPLLDPAATADALLPWPPDTEQLGLHKEYVELLQQRLGGAALPPAQAWLKALTPELLDQVVTLAGSPGARKLLGAMSWSEGDGEWQELYPMLVLGAQGSIARLQNAFHKDGAPGCHHALPAKLP